MMQSKQAWLFVVSAALCGLAPPGHTADASATAAAGGDAVATAAASSDAIERDIERARKRLDEAARHLADLHSQLWQMETSGPRADRPMLGILLEESGSASGLTLAGVTPDGGAERAGLQAGDTIVEVNGVRLDRGGAAKPLHVLSEAMASVDAGDSVAVTYVRAGETRSAQVETQARGRYMVKVLEEKRPWLESLSSLGDLEPLEALEGLAQLEVLKGPDAPALGEHILRAPAGLRLLAVSGDLARYFDVDQGIVVLAAPQRAAALKAGDVLLSLEGEAVTDEVATLRRLSEADGMLAARVKRRGREQTLELDGAALNAEQSVHLLDGDRQIRIRGGDGGDVLKLEILVEKD